jgi:hypothetical protein
MKMAKRKANKKRGQQPAQRGQQPAAQNAVVVRERRARRRREAAAGRSGLQMVPASAPVALATTVKPGKPQFLRVRQEEIRIRHCEKVATVLSAGSGVFSVRRSIALNPGLTASFPWLSGEAQGWETYRFNRLRFFLVPSAPTSEPGNWIMAPDYDASDATPTSETALSAYKDSSEAQLWAPQSLECDPSALQGVMKQHYVRSGALSANQDVKIYDAGNFFIASDSDASSRAAKLWVEYDVSLFTPQVPPGGFPSTATVWGATSMTSAAVFGTAAVVQGAPPVSVASNVLTISGLVPGQEYGLMVQLTGTVMSVLTSTVALGATAVTTKNSMVNAGATEIAALVTFTARGDADVGTCTVTLACTATTVTAGRAILSVLAPVPAF